MACHFISILKNSHLFVRVGGWMEVEKGSIQHDPGCGSSSAWPASSDRQFHLGRIRKRNSHKAFGVMAERAGHQSEAIREPILAQSLA